MVKVSFASRGIEAARRSLRTVRERWKDWRAPMQQGRKVIAESISLNIAYGGRPRWQPRRYNYAHHILQRTGELRRQSVYEALAAPISRSGGVFQVDFRRVITATPYSQFHQYGTRRMPARPFLRLQAAERERLRTIFHHHARGTF